MDIHLIMAALLALGVFSFLLTLASLAYHWYRFGVAPVLRSVLLIIFGAVGATLCLSALGIIITLP